MNYDDDPQPVYPSRYQPQGWGTPYSGQGCGCTLPRSCRVCADIPSGRVVETVPPCMKPDWKATAA